MFAIEGVLAVSNIGPMFQRDTMATPEYQFLSYLDIQCYRLWLDMSPTNDHKHLCIAHSSGRGVARRCIGFTNQFRNVSTTPRIIAGIILTRFAILH